MGFDLDALKQAVGSHGTICRVVIAAIKGSSPREVGAAMMVWPDGQSGTIGGGTLEFQAANAARVALSLQGQSRRLTHHPLGPALGQCCGGAVTLLAEVYDANALADLKDPATITRPTSKATDMPLPVQRLLRQARSTGTPVESQLLQGWMVEPIHRPTRQLWIWGAGHVGRAMAATFAPLPEFEITWVDTSVDRFPKQVPPGVTVLPAANPAQLADHTPAGAEHLILTYSHALDLELCHRLLSRDFAFTGLIGSKTKWARFRSRLAALGHTPQQIERITCPIGQPELGKHPQVIAIGCAAELLQKTKKGAKTARPTREYTA